MADQYFFQGVVLPERAQLSLEFTLKFTHLTSSASGEAHVSIILNQIAVTIDSEHDWNIFDLRNIVLNIVRNQLDAVGFLMGHAYDLEITRVISRSRAIDYVFGIDMPCLAGRTTADELASCLTRLRSMMSGENGILLHRCFADFVSAMKNADDTGFYCYRAIESLRHHCATTHQLTGENKAAQWQKFREISNCDRELIDQIKFAADPLRHGEASGISGDDRAKLLGDTWNIVDQYIKASQSGEV